MEQILVGHQDPLRPPSRIAFIGLGKMGTPMTARLVAAGYRVRGFDASADARARFASAHGRDAVFDTAAAAVATADALITMLPDGKTVREVLLGKAGVAHAIPKVCPVIDMSSSSPLDTQATGTELQTLGITMVDAPVSGGVKRAVDGSLAIMAGGPPAQVERSMPLLKTMGGSVFATGPLGSGHAMKALNNYVSAAGLVAAAEALLVGPRYGLDPAVMVDVLNASTGKNNSTENKLKQHILSGTFGSGFALNLMAKDLATARELAANAGLSNAFTETAVRLWQDARKALGEDADHTAIYTYIKTLGKL